MSTAAATTASLSRKQKWHSTPPPTPKILNLPRRNRHHRRQLKKPTTTTTTTTRKPSSSGYLKLLEIRQEDSYCYCNDNNDRKLGKLESLFGEEREFSRSECGGNVPIVLLNSSCSSSSVSASVSGGGGGGCGRRERVEEGEDGEKWKFQAEILRAECNFLRKEKEMALKKMERKEKKMDICLLSALQTLISGKTKMLEGNNLNIGLDEEIENMIKKLEHLQKGSGNKDMEEVKKSSNFDKQASVLHKRLEKLGGLSHDQCVNKLMADIDKEESCVSGPRNQSRFITDEEMQRMKMEGLPKEMLDRIYEDSGSLHSTPANSSVASSHSTSKRMESLPESTFSTRQDEPLAYDDSKCSGRCKSIVRKIVEQVRAETEQWTQMQGMLGKVREEMQQLQISCDFWEQRATDSENQIRNLQSSVEEWKEKALSFETKANKLQIELLAANGEIQKLKKSEQIEIEPRRGGVDPKSSCLFPLRKQLEENTTRTHKIDVKACNDQVITNEAKPKPISLGKQLEKEKRMLLRRVKEKQYYHGFENGCQNGEVVTDRRSKTSNEGHVARSPFRDIVNFSPLNKR